MDGPRRKDEAHKVRESGEGASAGLATSRLLLALDLARLKKVKGVRTPGTVAVKHDGLGRVELRVPLEGPSRFDKLSKEDTADIFDDLVVDSDGEESEIHTPSIAPATEPQRNPAFRAWKHPRFWEQVALSLGACSSHTRQGRLFLSSLEGVSNARISNRSTWKVHWRHSEDPLAAHRLDSHDALPTGHLPRPRHSLQLGL